MPRLRSLCLIRDRSDHYELEQSFDFRTMLENLPHLTSLRCTNIGFLNVAQILAIASHSSLEDVHIDSGNQELPENDWIEGYAVRFPITVELDEKQLEQESSDMDLGEDMQDGDETAHIALTGHSTPMVDIHPAHKL